MKTEPDSNYVKILQNTYSRISMHPPTPMLTRILLHNIPGNSTNLQILYSKLRNSTTNPDTNTIIDYAYNVLILTVSIIIIRTAYLYESQMGLTASHLHRQLDPFASKLTYLIQLDIKKHLISSGPV